MPKLIKVHQLSDSCRITLNVHDLKEAGFKEDDELLVTPKKGKLILTKKEVQND